MTQATKINFTLELAKSLKAAHTEALRAKQETFTFQGHTLLTPYAGYLLEHLSNTFIELK